MAMNLQRLTSTVLGFFLLSQGAFAFDQFKEYRRDRWDFEFDTTYFSSDANYVSGGSSTSNLVSGNTYTLWSNDFSTRYVPSRDWSIFGSLSSATAEAKNSVAKRTNSSFTDAVIGFDFIMYDDAVQLVPEVALLVPFEKVNGTSDDALNSEGVFESWARLTAQKDFGTFRSYGWLGFQYRGEGRSSLMPWGVGVQAKLTNFKLGGEIFGSQSITDDTSDKLLRNSYLQTVNAGSYKFYYPNPNVVDSNVYGTWEISPKWALQVNGGATLAGQNTAAGYHVGGFVRFSYDMAAGYSQQPSTYYEPVQSPVPKYKSNMYTNPPDTEISSEKKVQKFREDTKDGVDQNLFKPAPTVKPKTVDEELQNQLDQTEFNIQLKQDKKKKKKK